MRKPGTSRNKITKIQKLTTTKDQKFREGASKLGRAATFEMQVNRSGPSSVNIQLPKKRKGGIKVSLGLKVAQTALGVLQGFENVDPRKKPRKVQTELKKIGASTGCRPETHRGGTGSTS